jgi:hypothetical protein
MLCNSIGLRFCPRGVQWFPIQVIMSDLGA